VNKDLFTRVTGVPDKVILELTVPESPAITKKRIRIDKEPSPEKPAFKAQPMPDFSSPEALPPKAAVPTVTKPEPFDFTGESISRKKRKRIAEERRKQQEEEQAQRQFKAQPLYASSPESLPHVEKREVTRPEPFELATDLRGDHYKRSFARKIMTEEEEAHEQFSSFRARAADVV
jgi:hypothetical protein